MVLVEKKLDSRSYFFYMPVGAPYADAAQCAMNMAEDIKLLHQKAVEAEEKRKEENGESSEEDKESEKE